MAAYDTILSYINCATGVKDEIARIDAIIAALMDAQLKGALSGEVDEYSLDDGQTKIKQVFRDPSSILKAINGLEARKNMLINRDCLGRVVKLRDKDSFLINK
jgi:hypothetical protein